MNFFFNNININNRVLEYSLVFQHQYYPMAWIKFIGSAIDQSQNNGPHPMNQGNLNGSHPDALELLEIFLDETKIFEGILLDQHLEDNCIVGYFAPGVKNNHDIANNYKEVYETFHTWVGYFDNTWIVKPLDWNEFHGNIVEILDYEIHNLTPSGIQFNCIHQWQGDHFYESVHNISLKVPSTYSMENIVNFVEKNLPNNIIIEDYYHEEISHLANGVQEKIFNIRWKLVHWMMMDVTHEITFVDKNPHLQNIFFYRAHGSQEPIQWSPSINKILQCHRRYNQFNSIIKFTTFDYIHLGQWIKISINNQWYRGYVIKVTIEDHKNHWIIKGVLKATMEGSWVDGKSIDHWPIMEKLSMDTHWSHWLRYEDKLIMEIPHFHQWKKKFNYGSIFI